MRLPAAALLLIMICQPVPLAAKSGADLPALPESAQKAFAACRAQTGINRFHYHRCLLDSYARLLKETERLTDHLLSMIGRHRAFGRMRIIQWSYALTKSQSRWEGFVKWDCEWPGHLLETRKNAPAAMTECRIRRAFERIKTLENRQHQLDRLIRQRRKQP